MSERGQDPLGVLLMTYGSPDGPDDMPRYLAAVRGGRDASDELVIEFRRRYEAIGGSPLIPITQAQAAAVEDHLRNEGVNARVSAAMRFSEPSISRELAKLVEAGARSVVGVVMSPQQSSMLMGGYATALRNAADAAEPTPWVTVAPAWYREAGFLDAVADRIRAGLDSLGPHQRETAPVLLTAHSLPRRVAEAEPQYLDQLRETAALVARRAALAPERWSFCWQSAGHEPGEWMKPDFADLLPELQRAGHRSVLVAPIQFLADHLEVLYDLDIGAREQAEAHGISFTRIESLNVHPSFIAALAAVVTHASAEVRALA
ncbi:MAG TPA: ferrochelatase [Candidatus Limnocylindria bacterium]|nr:ferrochelatase [Candidatus Limnocylindria bacterium]